MKVDVKKSMKHKQNIKGRKSFLDTTFPQVKNKNQENPMTEELNKVWGEESFAV